MSGRFVTVEGGEGTGKSTLIAALTARLQGEVVATREPGGTPGAEAVRELLVSGEAGRWDAMTEVLLVTAARRDHVERVIRPALARGATVLCDRYVDSTRAYQGLRGAPREEIDAVHRAFVGLDPDRTLILDMDPEQGLERAEARGGANRYERMGLAYHRDLREAFLAIAAAEPERCTVLDAATGREALADAALGAL